VYRVICSSFLETKQLRSIGIQRRKLPCTPLTTCGGVPELDGMGRPQSFCFGPRGRNGCSCNLPLSAVRTPCIYNRAKGIGPVLPPRRRLHHPATISFRYVSVPRLLVWFPSRRSLLGHSSSFESSEAVVESSPACLACSQHDVPLTRFR
jgi:hypothetical protein